MSLFYRELRPEKKLSRVVNFPLFFLYLTIDLASWEEGTIEKLSFACSWHLICIQHQHFTEYIFSRFLQIWSEMQNDFLPNFILCNTTQRFVRSPKLSSVRVQKPSMPYSKPNFYCGNQVRFSFKKFSRPKLNLISSILFKQFKA